MAIVFLGALKVLNIRGTASINVGTQMLIGLKTTDRTNVGGAQIVGDGSPAFNPVGATRINDLNAGTADIQ